MSTSAYVQETSKKAHPLANEKSHILANGEKGLADLPLENVSNIVKHISIISSNQSLRLAKSRPAHVKCVQDGPYQPQGVIGEWE